MSIEPQNPPTNYIKFLENDITWSKNSNKTYTGTQRIQVKFGDQEYNYTLTLSNIYDRNAAKTELLSQITTIMQVAINHGIVPNSKKSLEYSDHKFTKINAEGVKKEIVDVDRNQQKRIYTDLKKKFTGEKYKNQITKEDFQITKDDLKDEETSITSAGLNIDKLIKNLPTLLKNKKDWQDKLLNIDKKIQRQQLLKQLILYSEVESKPKPISSKIDIQSDGNDSINDEDDFDIDENDSGSDSKNIDSSDSEAESIDEDYSDSDTESIDEDYSDSDTESVDEDYSDSETESIDEDIKDGSQVYTPSETACINRIEQENEHQFASHLQKLNNLSSQLKVLRYFNSSTSHLSLPQTAERNQLVKQIMKQLRKEIKANMEEYNPLVEIFADEDDATIMQQLKEHPKDYFNTIYDGNPLLFRTPFLEINLQDFRFDYKINSDERRYILSILDSQKSVKKVLDQVSDSMVKRKVIASILRHPETASKLNSQQKIEVGQMIIDDMKTTLNLNEKYLRSLDKEILFFDNPKNIDAYFTEKEKQIELYIRIFDAYMQGKIPETIYSKGLSPVRRTMEKVRKTARGTWNWFTGSLFGKP